MCTPSRRFVPMGSLIVYLYSEERSQDLNVKNIGDELEAEKDNDGEFEANESANGFGSTNLETIDRFFANVPPQRRKDPMNKIVPKSQDYRNDRVSLNKKGTKIRSIKEPLMLHGALQ